MATAEKAIWFQSSREQLDALLLEVCDGLQLRPSRHELAVERYGTVNEILEKAGSPFRFLRPRIFPQGSMAQESERASCFFEYLVYGAIPLDGQLVSRWPELESVTNLQQQSVQLLPAALEPNCLLSGCHMPAPLL